jgi:hypothetical protein
MRAIIVVVAVALLLVTGLAAVDAAVTSAGDETTVTNETWTPDAGNVSTLSASNQDLTQYAPDRPREIQVFDENGSPVASPGDYVWNQDNGTIKAVTGGELDGDASANISYSYSEITQYQAQTGSTIGEAFAAGPAMLLLLVFAIIIGAIRVMGGV